MICFFARIEISWRSIRRRLPAARMAGRGPFGSAAWYSCLDWRSLAAARPSHVAAAALAASVVACGRSCIKCGTALSNAASTVAAIALPDVDMGGEGARNEILV